MALVMVAWTPEGNELNTATPDVEEEKEDMKLNVLLGVGAAVYRHSQCCMDTQI
jgi:hypothetical protein